MFMMLIGHNGVGINTGPAEKGIIAFGQSASGVASDTFNLVSNTGAISSASSSVGTARTYTSASSYGANKGLFLGGFDPVTTDILNIVNRMSSLGIIAADETSLSTGRYFMAGGKYGVDKGIFLSGQDTSGPYSGVIRLSNTGVMTEDSGAGAGHFNEAAAASYGGDKLIRGFGSTGARDWTTVNASGVIASNFTTSGTSQFSKGACGYGGDKAIFVLGGLASTGNVINAKNLISNTGTVSSDSTVVATPRVAPTAVEYGTDTAIVAFGVSASIVSVSTSNLISNTGVVASDVTNVGSAKAYGSGINY